MTRSHSSSSSLHSGHSRSPSWQRYLCATQSFIANTHNMNSHIDGNSGQVSPCWHDSSNSVAVPSAEILPQHECSVKTIQSGYCSLA
ncbi:MAG: hypothetical protein [Circular genetic element sp.]|nr:MAG: hypothetical protein [Circular genetic element sp.]